MILILIGKSGSGKSFIQKKLLETGRFATTVSHTTRQPRDGEVDGVDYHFVTKDRFIKMAENGEFVNMDLGSMCGGKIFYGTHKDEMLKSQDKPLLMVLSPTGAWDIMENYERSVSLFIRADETDRVVKLLERPTMTKQDILDRMLVEGEEYMEDIVELKKDQVVFELFNRYDDKSLNYILDMAMKLIGVE